VFQQNKIKLNAYNSFEAIVTCHAHNQCISHVSTQLRSHRSSVAQIIYLLGPDHPDFTFLARVISCVDFGGLTSRCFIISIIIVHTHTHTHTHTHIYIYIYTTRYVYKYCRNCSPRLWCSGWCNR
jgi:hypothetical protein